MTILVLWVTVCSAVDALLTLLHIANGGGEANPVMALAINHGHSTFINLKISVTCLGSWDWRQQFPLAYLVLPRDRHLPGDHGPARLDLAVLRRRTSR